MGNLKKKGESGSAVSYLNRNQAIKKLQLKLSDFRRLCILKGVYPVEPKNKKKVTGGDSSLRTYYLKKDILHLSHEPLLQKFREFSVYAKKLKKTQGKRKWSEVKKLKEQKPTYSLENIIKERYPSFPDALRDLDDALCMVFLFANLPCEPVENNSGIVGNGMGDICGKLADEFMLYVIESHSLKKCFISIKGIYYQAEINGIPITWIVPHKFPQAIPSDVDFRVMYTFLEFYVTLLGFVNFRLYRNLSLAYPPSLAVDNNAPEQDSSLASYKIEHLDGLSIPVELDSFNLLFSGKVFFISREVVRTPFEFVIRAFGGVVGWEGPCSPIQENDVSIHYQIIDRPSLPESVHLGRFYVQPQFIFDCINARCILETQPYLPGATLPPHMSPFVEDEVMEDKEEHHSEIEDGIGLRPSNKEVLDEIGNEVSSDEEADSEEKIHKSTAAMEKEREQMAVSMMSKKQRKLYSQIQPKKLSKTNP